MSGRGRPVKVDDVLAGVLEKHGVRQQIERMHVVDLWPEIVGEKVAAVTTVKAVDRAALVIAVRNSAWLMELSMMRDDFLERVNARLADVPFERIVFVQAETE